MLGGEFKAGAGRESRERAYGIDAFAADASQITGANAGITQWGTGSIFIPENFGPGKFRFVPITVFTGAYRGTHNCAPGTRCTTGSCASAGSTCA